MTGKIKLAAGEKKTLFFPLEVVATDGSADVEIKLTRPRPQGRGQEDDPRRAARLPVRGRRPRAPRRGRGRRATSSTSPARCPGSIQASVTMYPSPLATMTKGMDGDDPRAGRLLRADVVDELSQHHDPRLPAERTTPPIRRSSRRRRACSTRGYKLLTGYETKQKGYEWFGQTPGHEALTAYGLMEFADMAKVYDVDKTDGRAHRRLADVAAATARAASSARRRRSTRSAARARRRRTRTSCGRSPRRSARRDDAGARDAAHARASRPAIRTCSRSPTNTSCSPRPKAPDGRGDGEAARRAAGKDGSFPGAKETITMSGGESLDDRDHRARGARADQGVAKRASTRRRSARGVDWLNSKRGGYGAVGQHAGDGARRSRR